MNPLSNNEISSSPRPYALITGASSGIGMELAKQFAADKHNLILVARSGDKLIRLAKALGDQFGIQTKVISVDLGRPDGADLVYQEVQSSGLTVRYLVNNAGLGLFGKHQDTDLEDEQAMINVNITALTRMTKLFLPDMVKANRGYIMNVASTAAFQPGPYMAVYYATKAYVLSYTEALATDLEDTEIRVTALCPGPTQSGFQNAAVMNHSALVNGKRLPTAAEVAQEGYAALQAGKVVAITGFMNWIMAQSIRITPRSIVRRLVAFMSRPKMNLAVTDSPIGLSPQVIKPSTK
jgi:uncharacterized protein